MDRKRILIIDSDIADLARVSRILEAEGYEVFSHTRTYSATELARQLRPHMILLDVSRRDLTGEKIFAVLRSSDETRNIPVVFWSSDGDEDALRASAKRFRARGYVVKRSAALLRHCVAQVLGGEIRDRELERCQPIPSDDAPW